MVLDNVVSKATEVKLAFAAYKAGKTSEADYNAVKNQLAAMLEEGGTSWAEGILNMADAAKAAGAASAPKVIASLTSTAKTDLALAHEHLTWLKSTSPHWTSPGWTNEVKGKLDVAIDAIKKHI